MLAISALSVMRALEALGQIGDLLESLLLLHEVCGVGGKQVIQFAHAGLVHENHQAAGLVGRAISAARALPSAARFVSVAGPASFCLRAFATASHSC